jgi:hypothetical protein
VLVSSFGVPLRHGAAFATGDGGRKRAREADIAASSPSSCVWASPGAVPRTIRSRRNASSLPSSWKSRIAARAVCPPVRSAQSRASRRVGSEASMVTSPRVSHPVSA